VKFIIMQFSAWSVSLPFRSKYPPQHSVLKNPQSVFFPSVSCMINFNSGYEMGDLVCTWMRQMTTSNDRKIFTFYCRQYR
jgi:hypothetical protein